MEKIFKYTKNTLHRSHKDTLCTDVSNNKTLTKMSFCTPLKFWPPFTLFLHNIQTSFFVQI